MKVYSCPMHSDTTSDKPGKCTAGRTSYLVLKNRQHQLLTLPVDAVIRDDMGVTVWVRTSEKSFKNKMVETGLETDD